MKRPLNAVYGKVTAVHAVTPQEVDLFVAGQCFRVRNPPRYQGILRISNQRVLLVLHQVYSDSGASPDIFEILALWRVPEIMVARSVQDLCREGVTLSDILTRYPPHWAKRSEQGEND